MIDIISVEKFKGSTYQVNLSEGEPVFLNSQIISQFNIRAGTSLPLSALEEIVYANDFRRARERAMYLLDYRDHCYADMYNRLRKNYSEELSYDVCDKLAELGLINDKRYAEDLARRLVEGKLQGYYKAVQEMRLKGLTRDVIAEALEPYEDTYVERIVELVERKYSNKLDDEDDIKKVKNALTRHGYSYDDIKKAFKIIMDDE